MARVLAPGGIFIVTFSNRWFPPKAIQLWKELHPFERMGLVRELFSRAGGFERLETFSSQGWPRPDDDKYAGQMPFSEICALAAVFGKDFSHAWQGFGQGLILRIAVHIS